MNKNYFLFYTNVDDSVTTANEIIQLWYSFSVINCSNSFVKCKIPSSYLGKGIYIRDSFKNISNLITSTHMLSSVVIWLQSWEHQELEKVST